MAQIANCTIMVKKVSTFCQSFFIKYASNFLSIQNFGRPKASNISLTESRPRTPGRPSG